MNRLSRFGILQRLSVVTLALTASGVAQAHSGLHANTTLAAFAHPFSGADHLLAMLAIGAWAAAGPPGALRAPLAFVIAAIGGALLGAGGIAVPALETWLALSLALCGGVLALAKWPSVTLLTLAAAVTGLVHGNAHGLEIGGAVASLAAFGAGTALLHGAGYALASVVRPGMPHMLRAAGVLLACVGLGLACA